MGSSQVFLLQGFRYRLIPAHGELTVSVIFTLQTAQAHPRTWGAHYDALEMFSEAPGLIPAHGELTLPD